MKLIELRGVNLIYKNKNKVHKVLNELHLELEEGEILGLVGESGCGKTSIGRIIVGLENGYSGEYYYGGVLQKKLSKSDLHNRQRKIQMIFQDPYMSIDPMMKMYDIIEEPMKSLRKEWSKEKRRERILELMKLVGLSESYLYKKSRSLSGGQLQRIGIARALACEPSVLVCDEPVSALDVSVQAQILNLMKKIRNELGVSMIFISHDLSVVRYLADRIAIMLDGKICELKNKDELFDNPDHAYTNYLLDSVPKIRSR